MTVHLVNPSHLSFGVGVITPRWLFVLAAATPRRLRRSAASSTKRSSRFDVDSVQPGDVVGIGIHTGNALRGYEIGNDARARGASVVFGGIHATLYPGRSARARRRARGRQGRRRCGLAERARRLRRGARCSRLYDGGRVDGDHFVPARWDLLPEGRYMWASVQTVRGCPKHCSFCSVWRTDGQKPRQRGVDAVVDEIVELRRRGFRFIALADDNFYPVTLDDLAMAERRGQRRAARTAAGDARRALRADGRGSRSCPTTWCSSRRSRWRRPRIRSSSTRCARAHIKGALVGVESVTPEGLKDVYKDFNDAGEALVERLRAFREHGVHVLGSFIFGLPSDRPETFDATVDVAERAGLTFAQFVMLTPFPGTVDFAGVGEDAWATTPTRVDGIPITRHWLIPQAQRPKVYTPHPMMSRDEIRARTQGVWDRFYSLPQHLGALALRRVARRRAWRSC